MPIFAHFQYWKHAYVGMGGQKILKMCLGNIWIAPLFNYTQSGLISNEAKSHYGQLISKSLFGVSNSPKKRTWKLKFLP